jgi:hypothetical protein
MTTADKIRLVSSLDEADLGLDGKDEPWSATIVSLP